MTRVILLSFSDKKYLPTLRRLKKEAQNFGIFDDILTFSEKSFDKSYYKKNKSKFKYRGYGYWIWKSYFVKREYDKMNDGDILFYIDSGCILNETGKKRFEDYLKKLIDSESGILVFEQRYKERQYTKSDLFDAMNVLGDKNIVDTNQIWAGSFFIRKCKYNKPFVDSFFNICNNNFPLITDKPSLIPNSKDFICHRHDQSVFSVLVKSYSPILISADETYPFNNDWKSMNGFPILAKRAKVMSKIGRIVHLLGTPKRKIIRILEENNLIKY